MFVCFELFGSVVDGTLLHANSTAIYDLFVIGCVRFFFVGSFTSKSTATMIEPYQIKKNCLDKCKTLCIYHGCVECVGFCCCFLFEHKPIYLALALCVLPNGFTL